METNGLTNTDSELLIDAELLPDFTDADEVRRTIIASEIINRKY